MSRSWTFGQKVAGGFAAMVVMVALIGGIAVYALHSVVASKNDVIDRNAANLIAVERLRSLAERKGGAGRAFLLTRDEKHAEDVRAMRVQFQELLGQVQARLRAPEAKLLLAEADRADSTYHAAIEEVAAVRRADRPA